MSDMKPYYSHNGITIYHGDCREILPEIGGVDLVLTDPPYGVGFKYTSYVDDEISFQAIRNIIGSLMLEQQMLLFMSMKRLFDMPRPKTIMAWCKPGSTRINPMGGFSEWEPILVYGKAKYYNDMIVIPDCVNHNDGGGNHPCPKPLRLMRQLIDKNLTNPQTILDPFMGSGTTLVAAKQLGRKAIGIELEEKYCEIAAKRLGQEVLCFD